MSFWRKLQTSISASSLRASTNRGFNSSPRDPGEDARAESKGTIGVIAGNGPFPFEFVRGAKTHGYRVAAVCHRGETTPDFEEQVDRALWIKVGELGRMIAFFKKAQVKQVAMAGGINRVQVFGGVKLDMRGAQLLARVRSAKDDIIMRGVAEELEKDGIEVISCTCFMQESLAPLGILTKSSPTKLENEDIEVGRSALRSMGPHHIGQVVVVREGVIVAVEAVEGTDKAILRGGELGGAGVVVVKCAKPSQDMRFDVPTIGEKTMTSMVTAGARVLAVEAGRSLILHREQVVEAANKAGIAIIGREPL